MSDTTEDINPDLGELLQTDEVPAMSTVPVRMTEAVTTYDLPARRVLTDSRLVDDVTWIKVLDNSKKRARAMLIAASNPIRIRTSSSGEGLAWPVAVPFPIRHTREVWVKCATGAGTSEVGFTEEFWAD